MRSISRKSSSRASRRLTRTEQPIDAADVVRAGDVTLDIPRMRVRVCDVRWSSRRRSSALVALAARRSALTGAQPSTLCTVRSSHERAIDAHVKNLLRSRARPTTALSPPCTASLPLCGNEY